MRCFAQTIELVDDPRLIAEYVDAHRRVWPEVISALRDIGIQRMRIFLQGHRLFMYYEAPDEFDPARDYQRYAQNPTARRWDEEMRRYQRRIAGANDGAWWTPMTCVFDLEHAQADTTANE